MSTTIIDTTNTRPPADYMRTVKECARERKRHIYIWWSKVERKWTSSISMKFVPFDIQFWSVSPTGFVTTLNS